MKNLAVLLFSLVLLFSTSFAQGTWELVDSPIDDNLVSLCFTDADHGWIISDEGNILITTDGGENWITNNISGIPKSIHFSDENHGCIVGWQEMPADSSLIMITSDGGNSWSGISHIRVNRLNDVFFINNDIGWAVGSYDDWNLNCCLYTSNGGESWMHQPSMTIVGVELFGVHFRDENLGQVCGTDGAFFITNNGGASWAMDVSKPILNLNALFNYGALTGCLVGDEGTALFTTNNWYQHIETVTHTTENLNGISGDPATNKLWAVGNNGTIIYSPNYLLGWSDQLSGISENLNDVCMINEIDGWAVGDNGTILHYSISGSIANSEDDLNFKIYPNPADNFIHICFDEKNTFKQIQLTSITGKLLRSMDVEKHDEVFINVANLPPGMYLIYALGIDTFGVQKIIVK